MIMSPDAYLVLTPFGQAAVEFPEDGGSVFHGDPHAMDYLKQVMARTVNSMGMTMTESNLEPVDLVGFCQPKGSGIVIVEPLDDLLRYGSAADRDEPVLDSALAPDVHAKVAELRSSATPERRARLARELTGMLSVSRRDDGAQ